jgi:hypothetical protein
VTASIEGQNAEEAGAHVTFTQDTWEHIYAVKDKKYPNERIVGWYHSHPGFGIFLSEHDTFIHKNFFASPGQVAWVFDPESDEEGCFGWVDGRIERLSRIALQDRRGGEEARAGIPHESEVEVTRKPVPGAELGEAEASRIRVGRGEAKPDEDGGTSLEQLVARVFMAISLLVLGALLSWYFLPRTELLPVLIDPSGNLIDVRSGEVVGRVEAGSKAEPTDTAPARPAASDTDKGKADDTKSK